jgi:excinuclease UvrABC nuclease subunit
MRESMFDLNLRRIGFVDEAANVYWLYDKDDVLLYVGSTTSLRTRLHHHYNKASWYQRANRLETRVCENRAEALDIEREAIRRLAPMFNRQGQFNRLDRPTHDSRGRLKENRQWRLDLD